jgi:hypothetical protein
MSVSSAKGAAVPFLNGVGGARGPRRITLDLPGCDERSAVGKMAFNHIVLDFLVEVLEG